MIMRDLLLNSVAIQPVDTLPADGNSSPLVLLSTDGKVYLWGKVIELNGPDSFSVPFIQNMRSDDWIISASLTDKGLTSGVTAQIYNTRIASVNSLLIRLSSVGRIEINFRDAAGLQIYQLFTPATVTVDQKQFRYELQKISSVITARVFCEGLIAESSVNLSSLVAWVGDGITSATISDSIEQVRPLQVCCVQNYLNGTLIDNLPCYEGTGTGVRNIVTPARAGSLSDATAWGMGWRAIT